MSQLTKRDTSGETGAFEVVLHQLPQRPGDFPLPEFCAYAERAGFTVHRDYAIKAGGLIFVPVKGAGVNLLRLAQFVFIREIKEGGRLRSLTPPTIDGGPSGLSLPVAGAATTGASNLPKVVILDGGLPEQHLIGPWLKRYVKSNPDQPDMAGGPEHGLSVASAFLFGPLPEQGTASRPLAPISFYRVLDAGAAVEDGTAMFQTLANIQKALAEELEEAEGPLFANLSLGPDLPARDGTVHAWTAVLDQLALDGHIFFTLAAGNNGQRGRASGAARVEVPSDCVNALGVGAADSQATKWSRATYSPVGPGRAPALVKPDLLAFGGSEPAEYFRTLAPGASLAVANQLGTSFASPYLLRSAVALRIMGQDKLSLITIKCLLIHYADQGGQNLEDVGWGRAPVLDPDERRPGRRPLIFHGALPPGHFLRADLPPAAAETSVKLKATFCYAPPVAQHDAAAYTQAALDISFVPDFNAPEDKDGRPPSRPFFDLDGGRHDEGHEAEAALWANVKSNANEFPAAEIPAPAFDIRYVDRSGSAEEAKPVPYSLVVTIEP